MSQVTNEDTRQLYSLQKWNKRASESEKQKGFAEKPHQHKPELSFTITQIYTKKAASLLSFVVIKADEVIWSLSS